MVEKLKKIFVAPVKAVFTAIAGYGRRKSLSVKVIFLLLAVFMGLMFNNAFREVYGESPGMGSAAAEVSAATKDGEVIKIRSDLMLLGKGIAAGATLLAFLISLFIRAGISTVAKRRIFIVALWIASLGCLAAWLPTDVLTTQGAFKIRALAGETPSLPAYLGKVILIAFLILSPPIVAQFFFRLELMDEYVVKSFLAPFIFCMMAFTSIWLINLYQDHSPDFSGLPLTRLGTYFVIQMPSVILIILPVAILLSLLFSLSKMSKANEIICMIGAGRSVIRILAPLFFIGGYCSMIALALKFEWAPQSAGRSLTYHQQAKQDQASLRTGIPQAVRGEWAKTGWMHVNDFGSRTWFVGLVPLDLSKPMANVIVWKKNDQGQPETIWQAETASWDWRAPHDWTLNKGKIYRFQHEKDQIPGEVPLIEPFETYAVKGWNETPWKVLSSSQNAEFMGMPGLAMFLAANQEMSSKDLAPFRTNRWNIFAEPALCLAMTLVAAPLGIVYSRKGVLGGLVAAVIIFALMYVIRGTTMALGLSNSIPPFWAAWLGSLIVMAIGLFLLWLRSHNRDLPKLGDLFKRKVKA